MIFGLQNTITRMGWHWHVPISVDRHYPLPRSCSPCSLQMRVFSRLLRQSIKSVRKILIIRQWIQKFPLLQKRQRSLKRKRLLFLQRGHHECKSTAASVSSQTAIQYLSHVFVGYHDPGWCMDAATTE